MPFLPIKKGVFNDAEAAKISVVKKGDLVARLYFVKVSYSLQSTHKSQNVWYISYIVSV